jgi:hypothetical protein
MKLYKVHGVVRTATDASTFCQWVGSQAECAAARKEFIARGGKRVDAQTDEVVVPTDKVGLLKFLNEMSGGAE